VLKSDDTKVNPLIYALTGEISPDVLRKIRELPFEKVFENIRNEDAESMIFEIKRRKKSINEG
jgi:hypothetical protein